MTRRDYVKISGLLAKTESEIINAHGGDKARYETLIKIAEGLWGIFAEDNPAFDAVHFMQESLPYRNAEIRFKNKLT